MLYKVEDFTASITVFTDIVPVADVPSTLQLSIVDRTAKSLLRELRMCAAMCKKCRHLVYNVDS